MDKKIIKFMDFVLETNKKFNLTSITDKDIFYHKHIYDSLELLKITDLKGRIIDIGTGAGMPGIPLAIYNESSDFTLIDSVNKKVKFIKDTCSYLDIKNVKAIHTRAEDLARENKYREQYDYVVTRAVAPLFILLEYAMPFLKTNGILYAYKGITIEEEIKKSKNALKLLNADIIDIYKYKVLNDDHRIVSIEKTKNISCKYPRKAGIAKKDPL